MYVVVLGTSIREVVGDKSTTDVLSSIRISDMIADIQRLQDHGSV